MQYALVSGWKLQLVYHFSPLPYVALNFLKTTVVCTVIGHVANEKQENLSPLPKFGKYCGIKEQAIMVNLQLFFA